MTAHYPGQAPVEAYGSGGFRFAGMSHRGSILLLPSGIYAWDGVSVDAILAERAAIDLLIIGTGQTMRPIPRATRSKISASGMQADAMATHHAISTYNLLLEEKRKVAAALIAVDAA